ncbi:MAG: hypothetical protein J6S41_05885 [Clostridia bacterium]|nr:hypothetical protein [Clostridia bacterium]
MPNKFVTLDTGFPTFSNNASTSEKVDGIMSYLYQLQESLRYMLRHLGSDNFDEAGLLSITEPISISLREDFNSAQIDIDASGLSAVLEGLETTLSAYVKADTFNVVIESLDGDITELTQTVDRFETRVGDNEKNYSTLKQTVDSFETRVGDNEKNYSTLKQTVDSFEIGVSSNNGSTTLKLTADGVELSSKKLDLTVKAVNISGELTADQIKSGTITGDKIAANTITADKLKVDEIVAGRIRGEAIHIMHDDTIEIGQIVTEPTTTGDGLAINTDWGGIRMQSNYGNVFLKSWKALADAGDPTPQLMLGTDGGPYVCALAGGALVLDSNSFGNSLPYNPVYGQVYFLRV